MPVVVLTDIYAAGVRQHCKRASLLPDTQRHTSCEAQPTTAINIDKPRQNFDKTST